MQPSPSDPPAPVAVRFPARVAAIDMGSNAIRFLAAEFADLHRWTVLEYTRAPVRLGHESFITGRIPDDVLEEAVKAVTGFRSRMDALEVQRIRAVATSAVRESANGSELVHRVWEESGIRLEPITGVEEARLVWMAIRERIDMGRRDWVMMDLGGGSLEISLASAEQVRWSESFLLGTVRLLEELGEEESPQRYRRLLDDHMAMLQVSALVREARGLGLIATGGNIEALAELAEIAADERGVRRLPVDRLREVLEQLAELSPRERTDRFGLRPDRADVIVPAAVVYERVARLVGAAEVVVPDVGVKDGVLLDVVEDLVEQAGHEARLEQDVVAGAIQLGRRYDFDLPHARQVTRLALELFDQLRPLHGLGAEDRRVLAAASLLHDVGQFVSYRRHHKHSYYLVSQAELPGFSDIQMLLVALVARYHRRAEPKESHEGFATLEEPERERVTRLAALLRVADALDREHQQQVEQLEASVGEREVQLELRGAGDLYPELWALQKKARLFERAFGLPLRVRASGSAGG